MNIINNKRKKDSQEKIEKSFIRLLQTKELKEITVSDICKESNLNRSTFYANYIDIYDLTDKIKDKIINDFLIVYQEEIDAGQHSYNFLKLFHHIKNNQIFYKTYFKLEFDLTNPFLESIDDNEILKFFDSIDHKEYHLAFFEAGINAIIKKWLENGCVESPEEINEIIISEYKNRANF